MLEGVGFALSVTVTTLGGGRGVFLGAASKGAEDDQPGHGQPEHRARDGGAAYQQLLRSGALCNAAQNTKALFHLSD